MHPDISHEYTVDFCNWRALEWYTKAEEFDKEARTLEKTLENLADAAHKNCNDRIVTLRSGAKYLHEKANRREHLTRLPVFWEITRISHFLTNTYDSLRDLVKTL